MLAFSIGLPTRFAEWCDGAVHRLAAGHDRNMPLVCGNSLDEIGLAALRLDTGSMVIASRQPDQALKAAVAENRCSLVMALDDPRAALHDLVIRCGLELVAATRAIASSCATMLAYCDLPNVLILRAEKDCRDPIKTAETLAQFFGVAPSPADISAIAKPLQAIQSEHDPEEVEGWWKNLDSTDQEMAAGALNGYVDFFNGLGLGELIWTRELFFLGDDPYRPAKAVFDLSGEVRNLLFGPYVVLPNGSWTATASLAVSNEAIGISFGFECLAGPRCICLARVSASPNSNGLCRATLGFTIDATTEQPVAMRVANLQPAAGGRVVLGHIALTTQSEAAIPADLSAALQSEAAQ